MLLFCRGGYYPHLTGARTLCHFVTSPCTTGSHPNVRRPNLLRIQRCSVGAAFRRPHLTFYADVTIKPVGAHSVRPLVHRPALVTIRTANRRPYKINRICYHSGEQCSPLQK